MGVDVLIALTRSGSDCMRAALKLVRKKVGATRPHEAEAGTIRGDFGQAGLRNLVHASDGPETAALEMSIYFETSELIEYERGIDRWILEDEVD